MLHRDIEFEWSTETAANNLRKHGVSFDEAETVFDDALARIFDDELHSDNEPREILIGYSSKNRLLIIAFVQRAHDLIRIISARRADRKEQKVYEETT